MNARNMRHLRLILLCSVASLLAQTGCAPRHEQSLKKIQLKLDELAQHQEDNQRDIQEVDSRLFLLEDKVETLKVIQQRKAEPKRHAVIRIQPNAVREEARPAPTPAPAAPSKGSSEIKEESPVTGGESLVEESDVIYQGEAKKNGPRPKLVLRGDSYRPPINYKTPRKATPKSGGSLSSERLPVVPLPRGSASARAAQSRTKSVTEGQVVGGMNAVKTYQKGLRQFQAGNYTGAIKIFKAFAAAHKGHPYADNALYWLGECYYDMRDFRKALTQFRKVVDSYPDENKAPDSLLKMSLSHMNLGDMKTSCRLLRQVSKRYPGTKVSLLAVDTAKKKCK